MLAFCRESLVISLSIVLFVLLYLKVRARAGGTHSRPQMKKHVHPPQNALETPSLIPE